MNKNKFFSPSRFYALLRNDLLINYKKYLLTALSAGIVIFLYFASAMYFQIGDNCTYSFGEYMLILLLFLMGLGVLIGLSFPYLSGKVNTTSYLMMPCSTFEKFAAQFLIRFILSAITFFILFWIGTHLAQFFVSHTDKFVRHHFTIESFEYTKIFGKAFKSAYMPVISILSIGLYLFTARLFFRKYALVKSVIVFFILLYLAYAVSVLFSHVFFPETVGFDIKIDGSPVFGSIKIIDWVAILITLLSMTLLPLGYFKLKEKQL